MQLLATERRTLETYLSGLDASLATIPLHELESSSGPGIDLFRQAGGPGLLIPREHGGLGAGALDAVRVQRAIGARAPSLAVASTMHHFSVASLVEVSAQGLGLEWMLLQAVAEQRLLLASGFAEGHTGRGILSPTMTLRRNGHGYVVSGSKKPCSLSRSMDFLTASVALPSADASDAQLAVVLVPRAAAGVEHRRFWRSWALAGAESDEIVLRDVCVPDELVFPIGTVEQLDPLQLSGFLWFELLITASYLGIATGLVERVLSARKGAAGEQASLGIEVEGAAAALECLARVMDSGQRSNDDLARGLFVRYAVQAAIERVSAQAVELLGGMAFVSSQDLACLYAACRALAFHPPSRASAAASMADFLAGGELRLP
jgi:alkylation response protein AidB-like acyl-CoA dehydrogenase